MEVILGVAVGRIGMSVAEFSGLTPDEFSAIYKEWQSAREADERGRWERCRWICYYAIRPYAKKDLRPEQVLKFGWDGIRGASAPKKTKEELEADRKEFERLLELWKDE